MPYKTITHRRKVYKIYHSNKLGKKYKVDVNGTTVHFGAKGYTMFPGKKRGQSYCARSSGIKGTNSIYSANFWSRKLWNCSGKRSLK